AAAEYGAEFRTDVEDFITLERVWACVGDYEERGPEARQHFGFVDPAGGSGADSMTLAISHKEAERVVVDKVVEVKPPFSPEEVINRFAIELRTYRIGTVVGDAYAGEYPREHFRRRGISYRLSDKTKGELYRDLLPALNSQRVLLPKNERLIAQLVGLERRVGRSGRDLIDHAPNSHDDLINACAGAIDVADNDARRNPPAGLWFQ